MRVFLSHSSRIKPLVREVRGYLPEHVNTWIDEKDLIAGDPLERSIRGAIQSDSDFLVVFIDDTAVKSEWVKQELQWAHEEEARFGRPFILPVLIEDVDLGDLNWLAERLYLRCHGFREVDVSRLASELSSSLFAWLSRDLERLRRPPDADQDGLRLLDQADKVLLDAAQVIRTLVFPHRKVNPLRIASLFDHLASNRQFRISTIEDVHELLFRLRERKLLAGIIVSAGSMYVEEEHLSWRENEAVKAKQAAADFVIDWIEDGHVVYLDAGSTTMKICKNICRGVRFRQWERLTLVSNSIPLAAEVAQLANDLGLEDRNQRLQLYLLGGRMRMNTSAVVQLADSNFGVDFLADHIGGFDVAFIGTNGVHWPAGCTTTDKTEASGKHAALESARRRVIFAESSKYNMRQEQVFADFEMGLEIITAVDQARDTVEAFAELLGATPSKIHLVP